MANYTSWLDISSMSGGSGRTSLTLTASRNYDDVDKSAQIVAYNPVYNVSATTTVYIQRHSIYPIPYTADTSLIDFTGETRTITIDASDLVTSSITVTVYGATGVTTSYNGGVVTVVFPENFGNARDISIAITGVTTDNIDAEAVIDYRQAAFNAQESYLTFLVESPGAIRWTLIGDSANAKTIEYRKNNGNWTSITSTTAGTPINVAAGDVVMFRGDNAAYAYDESFWNSFEYTDCQFSLVGNIMSLVNSTGFSELTALTADYTFEKLFRLCTGLTSASGLVLPATALSTGCYADMFFGCTGLTSTPELPATTLTNWCYGSMFASCESLTTAPALPATTLAESCYAQMFGECTSLTGVPSNYLPATTLAAECYLAMFENCTALTSAPVLPATSLRTRCYDGMFLNCESLVNAPTLPARTLASYCYQNMFDGCTSLTSAPALPATNLAMWCYYGMFDGCTSLTQAPVLCALTLVEACYMYMFKGCSGINYIECYATNTAATDCTTNWVSGVAATGTFVKNPDMTSWTIGVNGIPVNWIVEDGDVPYTHYLTFTVESAGVIKWTIGGTIPTTASAKSIEYKKNDGQWTTISSTTGQSAPSISVSAGDVVQFRGNNNGYGSTYSSSSFSGTTCQFSISGNIMSLINSTRFSNLTSLTTGWTFSNIFASCTGLTSAENLVLPATALTTMCYGNMFDGCTSLTAVPELPATTLASYCYGNMFKGCTSLITAPVIPATTLANGCYGHMFEGCTSLTGVHSNYLPVTAITDLCYSGMFASCTSLTEAPELPATTLAYWCYCSMFNGCTSLTTAPELPATTLAESCYYGMFNGCTSLTTAPSILPATTLANNCYGNMFSFCSSLPTAPVLSATTLAENCYQSMFRCCTSLVNPPELPVTTLASGCYGGMFSGCTSLTTAPDLPATTLVSDCYSVMFRDCISLNYINCLATDISASNCTNNWVNGVQTNSGTFVKVSTMSGWTIGDSGIPVNWIVENDDEIYLNKYYEVFPLSGSSDTVTVHSPSAWTVTSKPEWVTLSQASGSSGNTNVTVTVQTSVSGARNGTVEFSDGNIVKELEIIQDDRYLNPLTFSIISAGTLNFGLNSNYKTIQYKLNDNDWTTVYTNNLSIPVEAGDTVQFMGNNSNYYNCRFSSNTCQFSVSGNIMSLIYGSDFIGKTALDEDGAFFTMFQDCTGLTSAGNLLLPATTLTNACYGYMFKGCSSLTAAPELPATSLAEYCYEYMFQGCTSLTTVPALPATTLAASCYLCMFSNCTSLTTAQELPATTLAESCYNNMFGGCTSLTTAPSILPAATLTSYCYAYMFQGCTSLTTAPELPATTLAQYCYREMFKNCTNLNYIKCLATVISASCVYQWVLGVQTVSGTFIENHNMIGWSTGINGIPTNWRVRTQYEYMPLTFKVIYDGSINWLHNRTLVGDVGDLTIQYRINGGTWTSITSSTGGSSFNVQTDDIVEFQGNNATYGTLPLSYSTFSGSSAEFEAYGNVLSLISGTGFDTITALTEQYTFNRLFAGCTGLTNAEYLEIPAQTITMHCYSSMFQDCSNMTAGPTLPAPTLQNSCYNEMFNGCSSLANIKCLATDVSAYNCTYNWVSNVASSGTFVKASTMSGWGSGNSGIPSNWSSRNFTY